MEEHYIAARINFSLISNSARYFLLCIICGGLILGLLNIITSYFGNTNYEIGYVTWIAIVILPATSLSEYLCYRIKKLAPYRGIAFTILGGPLFYGVSLLLNVNKTFYPVINCEYFFIYI